MKAKIGLLLLTPALFLLNSHITAQAKLLPSSDFYYTGHITPKSYRGTWYNKDRQVGLSKIVIKKNAYKVFRREHGKWYIDSNLTGKKLFVYRWKSDHHKWYGFYAYNEDDLSFYRKVSKKYKGKKLPALYFVNNDTYYHSLKVASQKISN
ncbi:hypothetical protein JK163_01460 [Levilactobacillus brevis]|uniref:hypothetical protein n=1 Tax=Levilactobacillus brevis TaxID=1580 RepID=UPI001BA7E16A|nr:hypothetical protein [Levilactobacillus brevis]MBS1004989.1 hypothetical protein [Levilactobacillus brevis]MBS1012521.1 hypothetical protein [Levilactobacillus brevis]